VCHVRETKPSPSSSFGDNKVVLFSLNESGHTAAAQQSVLSPTHGCDQTHMTHLCSLHESALERIRCFIFMYFTTLCSYHCGQKFMNSCSSKIKDQTCMTQFCKGDRVGHVVTSPSIFIPANLRGILNIIMRTI